MIAARGAPGQAKFVTGFYSGSWSYIEPFIFGVVAGLVPAIDVF